VAAIEAGKNICLANKETLIAGGPHIVPLAVKHGRAVQVESSGLVKMKRSFYFLTTGCSKAPGFNP
jgi:hypothetical protein